MKRLISLFLLCVLLLSGCSTAAQEPQKTQYTATFLNLFDTVTTILGRAESKEAFSEAAQAVHDELLGYHQLFDIYNDYEGLNNLKTINDHAGIAPVTVDPVIIRLLQDCRSYHDLTDGKVNAAMGSVLQLWHNARNAGLDNPDNAVIPDLADLQEAASHTDFDAVIIDETASTVFISDPDVRLDVGAIAKGWAAQEAASHAPSGLLISIGGNVCATGPKLEDGTPWVVGIRDPDGDADDYLHTLYVSDGCVVTSGDYQRVYYAEGQMWHHIIDPDTLYPARYWRSVSIVCTDSGVADMLSTALFLLPQENGQALLDQFGAEAMWVSADDGSIMFSPGFQAFLRT